MKLKKAILTGVTAAMMLATATCFAQIYKSDLDIGGIYYGQPMSEVYSKYGNSKVLQRYMSGYAIKFYCDGGSFTVGTSDTSNAQTVAYFSLHEVYYKGNNIKTKAGISVGSMLADIKSAYGEPDEISETTLGDGINRYLISYVTNIENGNQYLLLFTVSIDGKVEHIEYRKMYPKQYIKPKPSTRTGTQHQQKSSQSTIPTYVTEIPKSELNIGGINPGQDINYVEQVYGKPTKIDDEGFFQTYNYNDKFIVKAKLNKGYKVTSVASYEKGLKMPGGVMVGMPYADVVKKYGKVNGAKFKGTGVEAQFKGCTEYTYYSGDQQAVFIVDKKGIVQGIRVEDYDEQKFIEAKRKK